MNHALRQAADFTADRVQRAAPTFEHLDWRLSQASHLARRVGHLLLPILTLAVAAALLWLGNEQMSRDGRLEAPLMCVAAAGIVVITGLFASLYERDADEMP